MDRLETGLILEVIDWDEVDNMGTNTSTHIHRIVCKYKKNLRELMLKIDLCIFYILHIKNHVKAQSRLQDNTIEE